MARNAENALPSDVTPAMIALGDSLFNAGSCQRCHGPKGVGANNGPSLVADAWLHVDGSYARLVSLITTGVPRDSLKVTTRRPMNPRGGPMNLTDDQVRAIAGYVFTISRGKR
jgi:mono/diheme cytochrome c family protein